MSKILSDNIIARHDLSENNVKTVVDIIENNQLSGIRKKTIVASNEHKRCIFLLVNNSHAFRREHTIYVKDNAKAEFYFCYLSDNDVDVTINYKISNNATVNHEVIFFATGQQNYHFNEEYCFLSPGSHGRFNVCGLLAHQAKASYAGNIIIDKNAQQTDARLDAVAHILSHEARGTIVPSLQIYANDVKAGHAGKISPLNESQLFYLNSKAVNTHMIKQLLLQGLFFNFINKLSAPKIQAKILTKLKNINIQ